jgi:hypothetical protein
MFDPDAGLPRPNRSLIYFGACLIAGIRLAREKQVNVRVVPTISAIEESIDLALAISPSFSAWYRGRSPCLLLGPNFQVVEY